MKFRSTKETGDLGEAAAANYFRENGYRIAARNYRTPHGEIDIIAENREYIVFAEVKTRNVRCDARYGRPADAVNRRKRMHLLYAVSHYLHQHPSDKKQRMDIIEVYKRENGTDCFEIVDIRHIPNAFGANG